MSQIVSPGKFEINRFWLMTSLILVDDSSHSGWWHLSFWLITYLILVDYISHSGWLHLSFWVSLRTFLHGKFYTLHQTLVVYLMGDSETLVFLNSLFYHHQKRADNFHSTPSFLKRKLSLKISQGCLLCVGWGGFIRLHGAGNSCEFLHRLVHDSAVLKSAVMDCLRKRYLSVY